ncbi:MAG: response regulator [Deltaproteobacteria bacterium]|nr:response regulator [Deltaproteobacteria bacterium]
MSQAVRVLVVEDDAEVQRLLRTSLTEKGYLVKAVGDGLKALAEISAHRPDVVVLDVVLPELDGLRLLKALKGRDETRNIPVIVVTAVSQPSKMIEAINAGARYYVVKPFDVESLAHKIATAVSEAQKSAKSSETRP